MSPRAFLDEAIFTPPSYGPRGCAKKENPFAEPSPAATRRCASHERTQQRGGERGAAPPHGTATQLADARVA